MNALRRDSRGGRGGSYDANGNRTQLAYPGGATIKETYDVIDRRKLVKDDTTTIAEYMYAGRGYRVLEKRLPLAGTTLFRAYDGDRRVTRHDQLRDSDDQRLAGYTYAWDRTGNRWYERTLTNNTNPSETGGGGEAFRYDAAYRMRDNFEGVTSGSLDGLSSNAPRHTGSLTFDTVRNYALDGVGNRAEVTANGIVESAYLLAGDDFKTNQYSFVDDAPQRYDLAGNLLTDGTWIFQYDVRNQLIRATNGTTDVRYRHDVLGRRVSKRTASGNFPGLAYGHAVYIQSGTEILQERDSSGDIRKEWVYGIRIDEPIRQRAPDYADLDNNSNTTELVDLYYLSNSLGSVIALITTSGTVAERYVMDVWGLIRNVIDKTGSPTGASWTLVGNPWTFTARQFDFEERTGLYHYRARAYRPDAGQFLQRDAIGVWGDSTALGRSRGYVANNPGSATDPSGMWLRTFELDPSLTATQRDCFLTAWAQFERTSIVFAELVNAALPSPEGLSAEDREWHEAAMRSNLPDTSLIGALEVADGWIDFNAVSPEQLDVFTGLLSGGTAYGVTIGFPLGVERTGEIAAGALVTIACPECCTCDEKARLVGTIAHESLHALALTSPRWLHLRGAEPYPEAWASPGRWGSVAFHGVVQHYYRQARRAFGCD